MYISPLSKISLEGREFFVKRDDLFDPYLAGNKFRKLYTLLQTPKEKYKTIISYGGAQSNAMLALSALCKQKDWEFIYYTKPLSTQQKKISSGNFADAINLGMIHKEIEEAFYKDFIASLSLTINEQTLLVEQGGALRTAQEGLRVLAQEIKEQLQDKGIDSVATPSGTGTTALFLAKTLPEYRVYTTACVGDSTYLKEQMSALADIPKNLTILESKKKYHFAKPYREFYDIYKKLLEGDIEFDLLYAPAMWLTLLEQTEGSLLYIHSGGVSGNVTMQQRYAKKFSL